KTGTTLTPPAAFNEGMADAPAPKYSVSGANTVAATAMTKADATHYTGSYVVDAGSGTATVTMSIGTDLAGNVVTATPTSGATFTVDNTAPTAAITYAPAGAVKAGTTLTLTAAFNEAIADSPVPTVAISAVTGGTALAPTTMTKVDSTHYTYLYTVQAGDGTATVT